MKLRNILVCAALLAPVTAFAQTWDATGTLTGTATETGTASPTGSLFTYAVTDTLALSITQPLTGPDTYTLTLTGDIPYLDAGTLGPISFGASTTSTSFTTGAAGPDFSYLNNYQVGQATQTTDVEVGPATGSMTFYSTGSGGPDVGSVRASLSSSDIQWTEVPVSAPEIDPAAAGSALTLLGGLFAMMRGRRRAPHSA